jgi:hypothetical protein
MRRITFRESDSTIAYSDHSERYHAGPGDSRNRSVGRVSRVSASGPGAQANDHARNCTKRAQRGHWETKGMQLISDASINDHLTRRQVRRSRSQHRLRSMLPWPFWRSRRERQVVRPLIFFNRNARARRSLAAQPSRALSRNMRACQCVAIVGGFFGCALPEAPADRISSPIHGTFPRSGPRPAVDGG